MESEERGIWDALGLLWPDFSALGRGEPAGLSALFIILLLVIAGAFAFQLVRYVRRAHNRIVAVRSLTSDLTTDVLVMKRESVRARSEAETFNPEARDIWREFDETLVESPDGKALWNTLDAEQFFNTHSLAPELVHNRLLTVVPALLTAIGVLGTFIGLATGLNGLELSTDSSVEELKYGIDVLIAGAAVAFMTSVWGVALSLIANFFEKDWERRIGRRISALQRDIDKLYKRHAPEQSLVSIMETSGESATALQELHERIGNQLQEAVQGLSEDLQTALVSAIETAMKPAMSSLVEHTSEQSSAVFESLVERFSEGFRRIGDTQAERMDAASDSITSAVSSLSNEVTTAMSTVNANTEAQQAMLSAASAQFQENLGELMRLGAEHRESTDAALVDMLAKINALASGVSQSSDRMANAALDLRQASERIQSASEALEDKFSASVSKVEVLAQQQESAASMFWEYSEKLGALQASMAEAASNLHGAAELSGQGFKELTTHQEAFLASLRGDFEQTTATLRTELSGLQEQMQQWLRDYSAEVSTQVHERMDKWNEHSSAYAGEMLKAARALSAAVEDLVPQP
ncbi:anti-phage ZorAB system protein ZorA [Salinibacterium sp. SYSU T00001]|uniref:anti-phage ZorAB system protein ZorA n=1 Tax=Homoserinimonas sedimenticola TaxID=2986805 RepID=UPI0022369681|nr:anti-phage ZorAB system protein ZorA [Salinibacterium sedimenticola]MCW4386319.1 anti-phage ZorAB system protein ZorA [Salinibacterium sedimenticola]